MIESYEDRLSKQKAEFKIMQEEIFSVGELEISRSDLDYQTALNAYRNTSFSSDKRAEMEQSAYLGAMQAMYDSLEPYAKNEEQIQILHAEMKRYQKDFLQRRHEILHRRSGLASSAITGGSNFPVRQQKKRQEIDDRKTKEFNDWNEKVKTSIKRKINRKITSEEKYSSLEKNIIKDVEIAATTEFRGEKVPSYIRTGAKARIEGRVNTLANNGQTEEVEKILKTIEDIQEKKGKTVFTKRHRIWKEKDRAERVKQIHSEKVGEKEIMVFEGGNIVNNMDIDRVQIFFDEIPSEEIRKDMKAEGWRFSRRNNNAWQRKNTSNAERSSKRIIRKHFDEKV